MTFVKPVALALTLFTLSAAAENRFCIGGDLQHLSPAAKSTCQAKLNLIRSAAEQSSSLDRWHFVVVCDEAGWTDYAAFSTHSADELAAMSVDTDMAQRSTYLRGSRLEGSTDSVLRLVRAELQEISPEANGVQLALRR